MSALLVADRHTVYRWRYIWAGGVLATAGAALLARAILREGAVAAAALELGMLAFGWGPVVEVVKALLLTIVQRGWVQSAFGSQVHLLVGGALWLLGWGAIALGIRRSDASAPNHSEAKGAALYPRLARYTDFNWGTLLAYGGGILASELTLILLHISLVGGRPQLSPITAFSVSLVAGFLVAFATGFAGASRAGRLSVPEATIGMVYFGLPIPAALTVLSANPEMQLRYGYRLREITYVAGLIGRPELGYWLVFIGLGLMLVLGITAGFVATGSGRIDLRTGFELFVARRHAAVFRPRLLLGLLLVLMLGIIPPLIVYAIVRAAEAAVERTRIRALGMRDPISATEALNQLKNAEQSPTAMMTALSVSGVGVGVMALIIVLSVMSGFEQDLQQKILGTNAHVVVLKYSESFPEYTEVMNKIRQVKGVVGATPFVMGEVMITSDQNTGGGVVVKGIDPHTVGEATDLPKNITAGSIDNLEHPEELVPKRSSGKGRVPLLEGRSGSARDGTEAEGRGGSEREAHHRDDRGARNDGLGAHGDDPIIERVPSDKGSEAVLPGIILGRELAGSLRVNLGDRVNVTSPFGGELGPQGPISKSRPFRVAALFYSGMYEYDAKFVYIEFHEAQKFFNAKGATGIELRVADIDDARRIANQILENLDGYPYRTKDWGEMNRNLFSALRLEKLVMGIILTIIVIVAAGLIIATVIMLVLEKRKEISVLKALGVPDAGIVKIFLAEGLQIGIAGGVLGLFAGLAWCFFIEKVGIKLDPQVYYIPALPVRIEPLQTAISVVIAVLVTYLASVYPAFKASQVEPVEGLKAE